MSASKKKKLRSENAGKLTERQMAEQKETKKLKIYTIAFAAVMVVILVVALYSGINRTITASGVHERNTVAATVGSHKLSNVELNYFYMDQVNNFRSTYGSYMYLYGIDSSKPLDQQVINAETGETWADSFVAEAISSARTTYAVVDEAVANGYTLPQDMQDQLDILSGNLDAYASIYGYKNADAYLKAVYGNGSSKETYLKYYENNLLASSYQTCYQESLNYTPDEIRAADAENPAQYSSYNYNQYTLSVSRFQIGGTVNEDGIRVFTDEEKAAAETAVAEAVAALSSDEITSVEELDAAIAALSINEGTDAHSIAYTDQPYTSLNTNAAEWISDPARQAGDLTSIALTTTSTGEDGTETTTTNAYLIIFFNGVNTNETNLVNARHILVSFEGETDDAGQYTDEAKAAALAAAEEILDTWKSGDATEDSFAALANEKSTDTGSNTNGGLYENIFPGQMVDTFNGWCFDASRQPGDTGIVETTYGCHVMYFVGSTDQTYRDYQITNTLLNNDMTAWYEALLEKTAVVDGDTSYIHTDIVLGN